MCRFKWEGAWTYHPHLSNTHSCTQPTSPEEEAKGAVKKKTRSFPISACVRTQGSSLNLGQAVGPRATPLTPRCGRQVLVACQEPRAGGVGVALPTGGCLALSVGRGAGGCPRGQPLGPGEATRAGSGLREGAWPCLLPANLMEIPAPEATGGKRLTAALGVGGTAKYMRKEYFFYSPYRRHVESDSHHTSYIRAGSLGLVPRSFHRFSGQN